MNTKHVQTLKGTVVSTKMKNTVTVEVSRLKKHPRYKKYIRITKRYKAHTGDSLEEGAHVTIESCRPISREKHWRVVEVSGSPTSFWKSDFQKETT